ncbi:YtxH domain-containing protein [Chryseolinea lacunae]|uniref:YtxH domain-containing protein n=1 Tax=Chryseolinea lacunae TaxID=2801331 RepID=A0ABS1KWG0_9BACT|nr:YtxH domain-containing protein [Chryseolinea lacunae]MBL0743017.1 YtxH domain-containing protein [Chryseolinea lacunae]
MNSKKALMGIVAGIAAGAVLGILLAPEKGSRTRRAIVRKGEDLADAVNDKIDEKFDELMDTLSCRMKKNRTNSKAETVDSDENV